MGLRSGLRVQRLTDRRARAMAPSLQLPSTSHGSRGQSADHRREQRPEEPHLGVGVGEHLGYLLTGVWSILVGIAIAIAPGSTLPGWLGWPGILIGAGLVVSSAEFLGPNEERGWALAGAATPILYIAWSVWLLGLGIALRSEEHTS